MTTEEFLAELEDTRHQFEWILDPATSHQLERRSDPRYHLRAILKGSPEAVFDPLAALCYVRTGKVFEAQAWPDAARTLSLDSSTAAMVLAATSDRTWESAGGQRRPVRELVTLRQRLLKVTGARQVDRKSPPVARTATPGAARTAGTAVARRMSPVRAEPVRHAYPIPNAAAEETTPPAEAGAFAETGLLATAFAVLRSLLVGLAVVFVSAILYVSSTLYVVGLSIWAERQYGGQAALDPASALGRPSVLWLIALLIFAAAFHREYDRSPGQGAGLTR